MFIFSIDGVGEREALINDLAHALGTGEIMVDDRGTAPKDIMLDDQIHTFARNILTYLEDLV